MERREQLIRIVSPIAREEKDTGKYVQHLEEFFEYIVPEKLGRDVCTALEAGDYTEAVHACAAYYRQKPSPAVASLTAQGKYSIPDAENCIRGITRVVNIDWEFPDGEVDFLFDPTEKNGPRNHEWLWQFNRHPQWGNMARAYAATGDERYAQTFEKQLLKWIAQTDIPASWNAPGSAWRTIECGIRLLGCWQVTFDGFRKSPAIADATILLMIASMHRQVIHLIEHPTTRNWLMMESNGVYTFASLFHEFSDSAANRKTAADRLIAELSTQILPDGMHNELSPDYQGVVAGCAGNFLSLAGSLGTAHEIPQDFIDLIRATVHAAVLLSTPALTQPRTNDTYTIPTTVFTGWAEKLLGEAPEYRFVNSGRAEGAPPEQETASAYLPYAGLAVMRSDWSADAAYLCFDVGPLGTAHIHQDMLNIHLYKGSRELIYDDGGGQYEISAAREYAISGYGHNTLLVDGLAQNRKGPFVYTEPYDAQWITNDTFDYAAAAYDDTFGKSFVKPAVHKREIRFCKPDFFCVSDTITSADGEAHDYEILFHMDTTEVKTLSACKNAVLSCFGGEYEVAVIPLEEGEVELHTVSAAVEPQMQGWYNGRNEANLHEAVTVSRKVCGALDFRFHTLLIPVKNGDDLPVVEKDSAGNVRVTVNGKEYCFGLDALNR